MSWSTGTRTFLNHNFRFCFPEINIMRCLYIDKKTWQRFTYQVYLNWKRKIMSWFGRIRKMFFKYATRNIKFENSFTLYITDILNTLSLRFKRQLIWSIYFVLGNTNKGVIASKNYIYFSDFYFILFNYLLHQFILLSIFYCNIYTKRCC